MTNKSFWKIVPITTIGFFVAALLLGSCSYEPADIFDNGAIDKITPSRITLTGLDFSKDSVCIYHDNNFFVPIFERNDIFKTKAYRVLLDGQPLFKYINPDEGFDLSSSKLSNGAHLLTLELLTNSSNRSIAAKIGYENVIMKKSWVLYVDKNYWRRSLLSIKNGYLHLSWPSYKGADFKYFRVIRSDWKHYSVLRSSALTQYTDSAYVGEGGEYTIELVLKYGPARLWGTFNLAPEPLMLESNTVLKNTLSVKWAKTPYYNALDSYKICNNIRFPADTLAAVGDPNVTSADLKNLEFGSMVNLALELVPKNKRYYSKDRDSFSTPFYYGNAGNRLPSFRSIHYVSSSDIVCYNFKDNGYDLCSYSTTLNTIKPSVKSRLFGAFQSRYSSDGSIACFYDISSRSIEVFNSLTQESIKRIPNGTTPFYCMPSADSYIPLDNEKMLIFTSGKIALYNYNTNQLIASYAVANDVRRFSASSDGKYIMARIDSTHLFKVENSAIRQLRVFPKSELNADWFEFSAVKSNELVVWDQVKRRLAIMDVVGSTTAAEFDFPYYRLFNIDYFRNEILAYSSGHLYVVDLYSGVVKHDIKMSVSDDNVNGNSFYLFNGVIFWSIGVMCYLN